MTIPGSCAAGRLSIFASRLRTPYQIPVPLYSSDTVRGFWGGWGSLRGSLRERPSALRCGRAGSFLPQAATQRAAEGRVRQATQEPYGHRQQSKGVPSPSRQNIMSSGPERFVTEKAEREAADSAARPKVSGKTALFPRNDRPYGLKCKAFQTEIALKDETV